MASTEGAAVTVSSGACADAAGNTAAAITSAPFKIDKTDPTINATAKKHDGTTYVAGTDTPQDVTVHFTCADGGSGIATCPADRVFTSVGTTSVTGTATDKAGNSASVTFGLVKIVPYSSPSPTTPAAPTDRTPPGPVTAPKAKPGDHWVVLSWVAPSANDLDYVEVRRSVAGRAAGKTISYKAQGTTLRIGRLDNNVTYKFVLVAYDKAGNASNPVVLTAKPAAVLLALPKAGTRVVKPPLLRWAPIKTADYFNVQLFRNGVKVLSAWPRFAHLQLTPGWKYGKTTITLKPGKYTWYVWPGLGKRADKRYGALLGKSTFVVRRPSRRRGHLSRHRLAERAEPGRVEAEPCTGQPRNDTVGSESRERAPDAGRERAPVRQCDRERRTRLDPARHAPVPQRRSGNGGPECRAVGDGCVAAPRLHPAEELGQVAREQALRHRPDTVRCNIPTPAAPDRAELHVGELGQRPGTGDPTPQQDDLIGAEIRADEIDGACAGGGGDDLRQRQVPSLRAGAHQLCRLRHLDEAHAPDTEPARHGTPQLDLETPRVHHGTAADRSDLQAWCGHAHGNHELTRRARRSRAHRCSGTHEQGECRRYGEPDRGHASTCTGVPSAAKS